MKMLLTSAGLSTDKLREALIGLLTKPVKENNVLIIELKWEDEDYQKYLEEAKQEFMRTGFQRKNIATYDLTKDNPPNISEVDVMMVFGGNNYHYLKRLRETGLMQKIRDHIERDGVYIGVSAGAMIMGPCIDDNMTFDVNDVGLEDERGFDFVDFYILPHWNWREERWATLAYSWETGKHVVPLTDQQGILVHEDFYKII